jgi:hypothetical protein
MSQAKEQALEAEDEPAPDDSEATPSGRADSDTPDKEEEETEAPPEPRWWEDFRDFYLTFDRRTLGLVRILLGFFLIFDLFRRTDDWWKMFANDGVLPAHVNLWRPQSNGWTMFNAFASRPELWALWGFGLAVFFCLFIGYKTKVMQVIAALYVASMNGRVLLIENGGYVVHNLLLLWTAFLPLGDRFSVDALIASMRTQKERAVVDLNDRETDTAKWRFKPHVTFVSFIILVQLVAIYLFNVIHKTGPAWHNGTAVHFVLYVDRMVNPLIGAVREYLPPIFILILTKSVMGMEAGLPLALMSPLARVWAKRVAIVFVNLLHIGFGSTFVLGPFAWALCVFSVLLLSREDWELAIRSMKRSYRARVVRFDPRDEAMFLWCRLIKRFDKFGLLTFKSDKKTVALAVTTPSGERKEGMRAVYDIVAAFPGGTVIAWLAPVFMGIAWASARVAGLGRRKSIKRKWPIGYRPELKDDADLPVVDGRYMSNWLGEHDRERTPVWTRVLLAVPASMVAGLVAVAIVAAICTGLMAQLANSPQVALRDGAELVLTKLGLWAHYLILGVAPLIGVGAVVFGMIGNLPRRVPTWVLALVTLFGGLFLFVYGVPMARKFEIDVGTVMFGAHPPVEPIPGQPPIQAWTLERCINWGGALIALFGAYYFLKPLLWMNITTPSTPKRKWLRVSAGLREAFAVAMFCGAINQALVELWVTRPLNAPQPNETRVLSHKLRYLQGWFMFSPNPVMDDGTIITDCITQDGRRIDPFSTDVFRIPHPLPPDMDLLNAKSYGYNQIWSDYYNRMHLPQNSAFRDAMTKYIYRLPERTGNANDVCVKGTVYWVHDMNPHFRRTKSWGYNRDELFTFTNPDPEVHRKYNEWLQNNGGKDPPEAPLPAPLPPKDPNAVKN